MGDRPRSDSPAGRRGRVDRAAWAARLLSLGAAVAVVLAVVGAARAANPGYRAAPVGATRPLEHAGVPAPSVLPAPTTTTVPPPVTEPPAPTVAPRPRPGTVFVVGDSLTVGAEPWLSSDLQAAGWNVAGIDARVSRGVAEGLAVLREHAAELPDTVLIALGTNDFEADPGAVATWLRQARAIVGERRIVWVNLCLADGSDGRLGAFRRVNAALAYFAPSESVELADWCSFASAHGVAPGPDGVHYLPAGYRIRAAFFASALAPGPRP